MRGLVQVALLVAITLGVLASILYGLDDRLIFVSAPEAVTEGFVRELVTERYTKAVPYLSRNAAQRMDTKQLREVTLHLLDETGTIFDVTGERIGVDRDRAEARAKLATERAGTKSLSFRLVWEQSAWRIDGGDEIVKF